MARFKIVKHRLKYHVIGFQGTKKPRTKGGKPTYKEQCISSHYSLKSANLALDKYKASMLNLSNKPEPIGWTLKKVFKEANIGIWFAIIAAIVIDLLIKFGGH